MAFGDSDLGVFVGEGEPVQFAGFLAKGIFNKPKATKLADEGFGGFSMNVPTIELPYNAFDPMPEQGDSITVGKTNYTIADEAADIDGAFVRYPLKAVS
jgi:hypothetical protein